MISSKLGLNNLKALFLAELILVTGEKQDFANKIIVLCHGKQTDDQKVVNDVRVFYDVK